MSDNGDGKVKQDQQTQPPDMQILITLKANGQFNVQGCIANEPLAVWMVDKAKDEIKAFNKPVIQSAKSNFGKGVRDMLNRR